MSDAEMNNEEEFEPLLETMRRDWDERAIKDAQHYVYTRDLATDESDFEASGRVNYDQLVRPFLPVLLRGRAPKSCRAVEIGCGLGRITRPFAENFLEVHGVDVSAEMIERARQQLARLSQCHTPPKFGDGPEQPAGQAI